VKLTDYLLLVLKLKMDHLGITNFTDSSTHDECKIKDQSPE